uniref:(Atlantic silverside) hypothetical protein n=1 Tax=Menidia menidia TaxID=238744 RepID=A0A8S4BGQ1_9TELE|nr:unnamed protein product [Menidia menidia]
MGPRRESSQRDIPGLQAKDRLSAVRVQFINGVSDSVLNQLLDKLLQHGAMINEEMQTAKTKSRAEKAPDTCNMLLQPIAFFAVQHIERGVRVPIHVAMATSRRVIRLTVRADLQQLHIPPSSTLCSLLWPPQVIHPLPCPDHRLFLTHITLSPSYGATITTTISPNH